MRKFGSASLKITDWNIGEEELVSTLTRVIKYAEIIIYTVITRCNFYVQK